MIKNRWLPSTGAVTRGARNRQPGFRVVGILRIDEILSMTGIAISRCTRISIGVTLAACGGRMNPGQRKIRQRMVEKSGVPVVGIMTGLAIKGKRQ